MDYETLSKMLDSEDPQERNEAELEVMGLIYYTND